MHSCIHSSLTTSAVSCVVSPMCMHGLVPVMLHWAMCVFTSLYGHTVTFHNTYVTLAYKLWLVPSQGTHHCHFHTTSEIPGTSIPHLNLDVIKSRPCFPLYYSISL